MVISGQTGPPHSPLLAAGGRYRGESLVSFMRLQWFIRLRWIMILCSMGFLTLERAVAEDDVGRPVALQVILLVLIAVNVLWMAISRVMLNRVYLDCTKTTEKIRWANAFANAQVAVDLLLLTGIIRYTGGVENPMAVFYLFHMAIVPLLLRTWMAFLHGVWAFVLYLGVAFGELFGWLAPHYPFLPSVPIQGLYQEPEFVWAAAIVVGCGIFGMLYFTVRIAARLDERELSLRQMNLSLEESQEALKRLQHRKAMFMRTAAHQLKSPLAVIQTQVQLMNDGIVPKEAVPATLEKIIRRCKEALGQIGDLLTYARVEEADPYEHRLSRADLGDAVRDLCDRYAALAEYKNLVLSLNINTESDLEVRVDPGDLRDCLGNLIENAIKYTGDDGRVEVTVDRVDDVVSVVVQDTGIGIPEDMLDSVFEPHRRGRNALEARISGSGLGLSIVRCVVERANGEIKVESTQGKGSTFTLRLPVGSA